MCVSLYRRVGRPFEVEEGKLSIRSHGSPSSRGTAGGIGIFLTYLLRVGCESLNRKIFTSSRKMLKNVYSFEMGRRVSGCLEGFGSQR